MPRIDIAYGPAATQGVDKLIGIGSYDGLGMTQDQALSRAGWLSVGAFVVGSVVGSRFMKNAGLGGAAVAFGVRYLSTKGA